LTIAHHLVRPVIGNLPMWSPVGDKTGLLPTLGKNGFRKGSEEKVASKIWPVGTHYRLLQAPGRGSRPVFGLGSHARLGGQNAGFEFFRNGTPPQPVKLSK
jgi:hypothetical protein